MGAGVQGAKCELCGAKAILRCDADAASLCRACDARVHGANFLVARHVRTVLCSACDRPAKGRVAGPSPPCPVRLCPSCTARPARQVPAAGSAVPGTGSASCCSSLAEIQSREEEEEAPAAGRRKPLAEMEGVLRRWHRRLNLRSSYTVPLAVRLVAKTLPRVGGRWINAGLRFKVRICLAASLWIAAKLTERRSVALKDFEECTQVPSKLVVLGERKVWNTRRIRVLHIGVPEAFTRCDALPAKNVLEFSDVE